MIKLTVIALRIISFATLFSTGSGCATYFVWWKATSDPIEKATLYPLVGLSTRFVGARRELVARYDFDWRKVHLVIPLDANGNPPPPFGYVGNAQTRGQFWASISEEQKQAILRRAGEFRTDLTPRAASPMVRDPRDGEDADYATGNYGDGSTAEIRAIALRITSAGITHVPVFKTSRPGANTRESDQIVAGRESADVHIVLLPEYLVVDPLQRTKGLAIAAAVTPATVAFDIAMLPITVPLVAVFALAMQSHYVGPPPDCVVVHAAQPSTGPATPPANAGK